MEAVDMGSALVNVVAALIVTALVGTAGRYIYKEKKKGTRCIGCPMAGDCAKAKAGACAELKNIK